MALLPALVAGFGLRLRGAVLRDVAFEAAVIAIAMIGTS